VADRDRESVSGVVGARRLRKAEQGADHSLDLLLAGRAGAADRQLHRLRRVVEAADPARRRGEHRDTARLPDRHRGAHVLSEVDVLEGERLGLVPGDQLDELAVDPRQPPLRRLAGGRLDHAAVDRAHASPRHAHDPEARVRDARVYSHDDHHGF
jgi:hypothetical protein